MLELIEHLMVGSNHISFPNLTLESNGRTVGMEIDFI
jgi:hypothetical protein